MLTGGAQVAYLCAGRGAGLAWAWKEVTAIDASPLIPVLIIYDNSIKELLLFTNVKYALLVSFGGLLCNNSTT